MKNIKLGCCLFFVLTMLLVSCSSNKPAVVQNTVTTEKTITETVHDTVFKIEKDSASYKALLDCVNGKAVIKDVKQVQSGRTLKSPEVWIADNLLQVDCETRAQELFAKWKSTYSREKIKEIRFVPVTTNVLTWWQKTQLIGFKILAALFILILLAIVFKTLLKKTT